MPTMPRSPAKGQQGRESVRTDDGVTRRAALTLAGVLVVPAARPAAVHDHVKRAGEYVLRAHTVRADTLPAAMRKAHGIAAGQGVLRVVVQRRHGGRWRDVPATLMVSTRGPYGVPTRMVMRQVATDAGVSYVGVYEILPRSVLNFRITARPEGARTDIGLVLTDWLGQR